MSDFSVNLPDDFDEQLQKILQGRLDSGEDICPKDFGHLTKMMGPGRQHPGSLVKAPAVVVGWSCEHGHLLAMGDKPLGK